MLHSRFWEDSYIAELPPTDKLLFIYFLTNTHISLSGIYEIPLRNIALDTGIEVNSVEKSLDRFSEDKKIAHRDGWICVINYPKYQNYQSPTIKIAIQNELKIIPIEVLRFFTELGYPIDTLSIPPKGKGKGKGRVKVEGEYEREMFKRFWIEYPKKVGKKSAEQSFLKIRNLTPELFKKIIATLEDYKKSPQWTKDEGRFIPHPTTWLNQERWNDEVSIPVRKSKYDNVK